MIINIKYNSIIATAAGKQSEVVKLKKESTIEDLVVLLSECYGGRFKDVVFMNSGTRRYLISFIVNNTLSLPDKVLQDGDEVVFVLALGGG